MGNSTASAAAEAAMADVFADMLLAGGLTFASFECGALAEGHAIMARAMGRALERLDAALCAELPPGLRVWSVNTFLDSSYRDRPASLNSTGDM